MLKVKLLNDGGYGDMENVKFPVIVNATPWCNTGLKVSVSELNKHGATISGADSLYFSLLEYECEVVNE